MEHTEEDTVPLHRPNASGWSPFAPPGANHEYSAPPDANQDVQRAARRKPCAQRAADREP